MDKNYRHQMIQIAALIVILLAGVGVILSLTACTPTKTDTNRSYTAKERAYLSDVQPVLGADADTDLEESSVIAIGKLTCQQREAGISTESIIAGLTSSWTELGARVMVNAADKYFCK